MVAQLEVVVCHVHDIGGTIQQQTPARRRTGIPHIGPGLQQRAGPGIRPVSNGNAVNNQGPVGFSVFIGVLQPRRLP